MSNGRSTRRRIAAAQTDSPNGSSAGASIPHDLEAERALLSAALVDPDVVIPVLDRLPDDAFYHPAHTAIAIAALDMAADAVAVDLVTVAARLEQTGQYDHAAPYLLDVAAACGIPTSAPGYAGILDDHARRRRLLALAGELHAAAVDGRHRDAASLLEAGLDDHRAAVRAGAVDRLNLIDWSTVWHGTDADDWLFPDVLARGRGHAIYAARKDGKSLLMLWLAVQVVATMPDVAVVYFDLEMTEADVVERLQDMAVDEHTDLSRLHYCSLPSLPPLDTPEGGRAVEQALEAIAARHDPDVHLLAVFDTTSRIVSGPENDADTFRAFYEHTGIRLKRRGDTYARLDHAGKDVDRGQRGSSAKADDVDIVWQLKTERTGDATYVTLKADHARMSWVPGKITFTRRAEPLAYERVMRGWPAGTAELAAQLDRLDVPVDGTSRRAARRTLADAGVDPIGSNERLGAAIDYRREPGYRPQVAP